MCFCLDCVSLCLGWGLTASLPSGWWVARACLGPHDMRMVVPGGKAALVRPSVAGLTATSARKPAARRKVRKGLKAEFTRFGRPRISKAAQVLSSSHRKGLESLTLHICMDTGPLLSVLGFAFSVTLTPYCLPLVTDVCQLLQSEQSLLWNHSGLE